MGATYRTEIPIHVLYRVIVPVLAGVVILVAGFLPWLVAPLQNSVTAWQIPVDIGWQIRFGVINYGFFCLFCAVYPFVIAYRAWRGARQGEASSSVSLSRSSHSCIEAAWLCCIPVGLWLWQYLFVGLGSIAQLTRQEIQYLLTTQRFDYTVVSPLIPITNPLTFDPLSLSGRFILLVDQLGIGPFLPLFSAVLLVVAHKLFMDTPVRANLSYLASSIPSRTDLLPLWDHPSKDRLVVPMEPPGGQDQTIHVETEYPVKEHNLSMWAIAFVITLLVVIVFGRAPLALACNYQAQHALYAGDYAGAYRWFDYASELNPALELLSSYHTARGQAWYFLHLHQDSVDSHAYLASAYLEQKDYLSAYQELNRVWQSGEHASWLADEISMILTQLAMVSLPRTDSSVQSPTKDSAALAWFNQLLYVDPQNVFGQYMVGRIQYDLHNYSQCEAAMRRVIALSQSMNVLSSAYTYLALSSDGQGDYVDARVFLLQAVSLDPKYRNNTAREELSGLR